MLRFISYVNRPNLTQTFTQHTLQRLCVTIENDVTVQRYGRLRNQLHCSMRWVVEVRLRLTKADMKATAKNEKQNRPLTILLLPSALVDDRVNLQST